MILCLGGVSGSLKRNSNSCLRKFRRWRQSTLNMIFSVTNSNCKTRYSVTNTKTQHCFFHSFNFFIFKLLKFLWRRGIIDSQCYNHCHLPSNFSSKFQSSMTMFHHKCADKRMQGFGQWMNSSIIHDNVCSLIHNAIRKITIVTLNNICH